MRQPNGKGSITKKKGNRRKPWMVRLPASRDNPEMDRKVLGHFRTFAEAQAALDTYALRPTSKPDMTLGQIWEEWKQTRAYTELAHDTKNNYNASWKKRLYVLSNEKMKDIRTGQLQMIIDKAESEGLGKSSMVKDKTLMGVLFSYAMKNDIVSKNYAEFVELPRGNDTAERTPFTDIELAKIENAVGAIPFADCVLIMCYTGFRIAEFLELTPFSYDPTVPSLTGGKKTRAGKNRVVPLNHKIAALVAARAARGGKRLVCKQNGDPYNEDYFRENIYYPTLEAIGVRKLVPHCTRHTFATLCEKAGLRPEEIKRLMGHTKYEMSLHYTHAGVEQLKNAIERIG